jgi:hypothetical protein
VLLLVVNGAVTIGISIAAWPAIRRTSEALALWLVVLGALMPGVQMVDNIHTLSMLSLSQAHAAAGATADSLREVATATSTTAVGAPFGAPCHRRLDPGLLPEPDPCRSPSAIALGLRAPDRGGALLGGRALDERCGTDSETGLERPSR